LQRLIYALATLAVAGLAAGESESPEHAAQNEIRAHTANFVKGFNSGNLDLIMSFYAKNYLDLNMPKPAQTWAERRAYYGKIMERADSKVEVQPEEIVVSGDVAVVRGTILLYRTTGGTTIKLELRYMELARKFPEGWRAVWGMDAELYPEEGR